MKCLKNLYKNQLLFVLTCIVCMSCSLAESQQSSSSTEVNQKQAPKNLNPQPAAENYSAYLSYLKDKKIALVVNHTSMIGTKHLVDYLLDKQTLISKIFTPEHGFTGTADAGEKVYNDVYKNIDIVSLYGKNKKPTSTQLNDIDLLVFDMQDVGARFYTYISTMHYVMEAAAENDIAVLILDRPNPNGHFVDGPVRTSEFESFIAQHPIPVVHGMTVGELAQMINGEGWLENGIQCNLTVIPSSNYDHTKNYILPVKPSPNLPNQRSVYLYPGLCFFEGTVLSIGRGTQKQFQIIGHPALKTMPFEFTPVSSAGAKYPKLENQKCYGVDLSNTSKETLFEKKQLDLSWLLKMYNAFEDKNSFFLDNGFFDKLAGTVQLRQQITNGLSEAEIRAGWQADIDAFKLKRKRYLLYTDFE